MAKYKRRIYCKFCDFFCYEPDDFVSHLEKHHDEMIPEDMTPWQFSYYLRTNKTHGSCIVCKKDTSWNEKTHKYNRFCGNPACKEKYKEIFKKRMIGKYGKTTLLNDPEHQKKMLANRKISGTYLWRDHVHKTNYTGSYEKDFLIFLDQIMNFDPEDVMAPSPHTYYYMYEGKKHFYIPDFFIPSLGLEIEIKDGGDNPNMHHKIQDVDKVKEKLKDEVMMKNHYDYIKIVNKDNKKFFEYLDKAKDKFFDETKKTEHIVMLEDLNKLYVGSYITESVLVESDQKSNIDKNFKKKSNKSINSKALDIHSKEAKKYIDNDSYLSSLKPKIKKFNGEIIVDQDKEKIIGRFLIGTGKDKGFIGALRVNDAYKGYGYGNQLIEDAINKYNGEDLIVYKDNEVAREIYKKHGFVDVNCNSINNKSEYYMKLKSKLTDSDNINEKSFTESVYDFDESDWNGEDTTELFFKEDWTDNPDDFSNYHLKKEAVSDDIFEEDSKHDYEKYNYGDQYVKNLRKVDILKSQLQKGKITQEEFDKKYSELSVVQDEYGDEFKIPKTGTKQFNITRPNKNKADDSFKKLKYNDEDGINVHGKVSDSNGEKFDHYNNILKRTEDYREYKTAFKNLSRLLGHSNACTIKVYHGSGNGRVNYQCFDSKKFAKCTPNTKLYHTSRQKGLTRLSGKFRGEEGFYFSSKRVYFHKDNPGGRMTGSYGKYIASPGEYVYEYIGDPTKAYIDPELEDTAVFIETETSIPVKDVTEQFIKKDDTFTESLETFLTTNPFESNITVYHGSVDKMSIIKPTRLNVGTKISKPRMSSFWGSDYMWCKVFAVQRLIENHKFRVPNNRVLKFMNKKIPFTEDLICLIEDKNNIEKLLRTSKIYIYTKTFNKKFVGIGHNACYPEISCDFPVKPDKCDELKYEDFKDVTIRYVTKDELNNYWTTYCEPIIKKDKKFGKGKMIKYSDSERRKISKGIKTLRESVDTTKSYNIVNNGNSTSRTMQAESDAKKKQIELNNTKYNGSNDKTNTQSQQLASLEHDKDGANKKTINKINKAKMLTIKNNMNDNKPVTEDADIIDS